MEIMAQKQSGEDGHDILVVDVAGSSGNSFCLQRLVRVVKVQHGTAYTHARGKNILKRMARYSYSYYGPDKPSVSMQRAKKRSYGFFQFTKMQMTKEAVK